MTEAEELVRVEGRVLLEEEAALVREGLGLVGGGDLPVVQGKGLPVVGRSEQDTARLGKRLIPSNKIPLERLLMILADPPEHRQVQVDDFIVDRFVLSLDSYRRARGPPSGKMLFLRSPLRVSQGMHLNKKMNHKRNLPCTERPLVRRLAASLTLQ